METSYDIFNPANVDPMLLLMRAEAESVADELEAESSYEQTLTVQQAALHITRVFNKE